MKRNFQILSRTGTYSVLFLLFFPFVLSGCSESVGRVKSSISGKATSEKGKKVTEKRFIDMTKEERLARLNEVQRHVTQNEGTEAPFTNKFYKHKEDGIYVDIVSGKPLFSSKDKFDTDCGWPSFAKPLEEKNVDSKIDYKVGYARKEIHSTDGTHLGHVFEDGPKELGGLRYCINSASLHFIPKKDLEKEGYGEYLKLFK